MSNQQGETVSLTSLVAEATMQAAATIVVNRPTLPKPDPEKLAAALRAEIKAHYFELLAELKAANEAHMGEPMLRAQINASVTEWAIAALKAIGFLGEGPSRPS